MSEIKIGPPPSPNRKQFPFVGTTEIQGIKINIENLAGSIRQGKDATGKPWAVRMRYHYGEIVRSKGTDGDKLDVYIGPNPQSKMVFIVHQNHPATHPTRAHTYDEDKIMLGFDSAEAAKRAYLKQYNRPDFFRSITAMHIDKFKKALVEDKGEKLATAKKKRVPSAFIRMKLRESHLKEAYMIGVRLALKEAGVSLLGQDATAYVKPAKDPDTEIHKNVLKGKLNKKVVLKDKLLD